MSSSFLGQFENSVTNRRISIPHSFRKLFTAKSKMKVIIVRGINNTIYVYPHDNWQKLQERLAENSNEEKKLFRISSRFFREELKVEGPGRILVPERFLDLANIKDRVIILGEGNYFSLWNPENFKKHLEEIDKNYNSILKKNRFIL
ncbi:MAG: hypothetical protein H8E33_04340 [Candidatus Cloacimonetes bacterium]|nr:hypothetical protein [Candidatus Cloacimonadota bacterium]MBL7108092.1 hypothetical protein [Candidatus Cloacimonadota bacterium]